jgi:hypothetical protein
LLLLASSTRHTIVIACGFAESASYRQVVEV